MKILQNKFIVNPRNNKCLSSMSFCMTTTTKTAATLTATIMTLMQVIVSVNTAKTGSHTRPDAEIATAAVATITLAKTFNINSVIAQQQARKTETLTPAPSIKAPSSSVVTSLKASRILSPFHMSNTTKTMPQTKARSAVNSALATVERHCKFHTDAWGDIDPNVFYICDAQTKNSLQLRCPEGTGFFLGLGYAGCIPYEQWPACLSSRHVEQVSVCESEHMQQPWESKNPNKFYVCLKEAIEPAILNCEPGKGFVHATVTTSAGSGGSSTHDVDVGTSAISEILGCTNWEKWRNYMQCNDYY